MSIPALPLPHRRRVAAAVFALLMLCSFPALSVDEVPALNGLDAFIEAEMAREQTPGLAIAVVRDGKVVYQRGFGYRDLERKLPVTQDTAFPIASVTKSFTVLTLGSLVGEGRLDWDKPVHDVLPDFQLYDPVATERMTPRDLVSHRSGLPRHDAVWYGSRASRREMWQSLRYLQPNADFRGLFQYNNLMFLAAGYLAGEVGGQPWESLLEQKVLAPLGMHDTSVSLDGLLHSRQPATGYGKDDDNLSKLEYANIDAIAPAGAINSTLADMTRYLQLHLGNGALEGRQVFDAGLLEQMRTPLIASPESPKDPEFGRMQYGMGLFLGTYRGYRHVYHGGNIDGFASFVSYLPEQGIGVVMLSNLDHSQLRDIVPFRIYDQLLGLQPIDWSGRLQARNAVREAAEVEPDDDKHRAAEFPLPSLQKKGTQAAHSPEAYAGEYRHPAYGTVGIGREGRDLTIDYHGMRSKLQHYHYETFIARADAFNDLDKQKVLFNTGFDGEVGSLSIQMEPAVQPIVFERAPDPGMRERSFLEPLAGTYLSGPDRLEVALRADGTLMLVTSGRSYVLKPLRGNRFAIEGLPEQSIEFVRAGDGRARGFVQYRPGGDRVAKRQ